ncbi:hypothetical protein HPB48_019736 [Haemaphysalis longicornis]|uniref:Endonuclease/exonuclease/phosphatase domain-containing protein n=1 Tax=Haemaphysalis longicornis TaxID=44386 RepID=A0A9J6G6Y1_HAELO|nr:hypothetical protein HPB48_019736 [Haemaphysalis longicornis]
MQHTVTALLAATFPSSRPASAPASPGILPRTSHLFANVSQYTWQCLPHTLGSDHSIVHLTISGITKTQLGVARLTDWKAFRDTLEATPPANSDLDE